jgi:hypothetical protein
MPAHRSRHVGPFRPVVLTGPGPRTTALVLLSTPGRLRMGQDRLGALSPELPRRTGALP